jgi:hypothetical protein
MSWFLGHGFLIRDLHEVGIAILMIAFVKIRYVILDFMEIRAAPLPLRIGAEVWVAVVATALVFLYAA